MSKVLHEFSTDWSPTNLKLYYKNDMLKVSLLLESQSMVAVQGPVMWPTLAYLSIYLLESLQAFINNFIWY
jgi:hypothetical protein